MQRLYTHDIGGLILIPITLGKQHTWWVVDTGSSHNLIHQGLANQLKLKALTESKVSTIGGKRLAIHYSLPPLRLGELLLNQQTATAVDLAHLNQPGLSVAGILGMPALNQLVLSIDFQQSWVSLSRTPIPETLTTSQALPFNITKGIPTLRLATNPKQSGQFILDTGNAGALIVMPAYANLSGHRTQQRYPYPLISMEDLSGNAYTGLALLPQLQLGQQSFSQVPILLPTRNHGLNTFAGSIGNALFEQGLLVMDFPRQRMFFRHRQNSSTIPGHFGFLLSRNNHIVVVMPGSSAAQQGIQAGDKVIAINQQALPNTGSQHIWQQLIGRNQVQLSLLRNNQAYTVNLQRSYFLPTFGIR